MSLQRGDRVKITNKNNLEGEVVGFYTHTMDAVVRTAAGHEWIVSQVHLKKVRSGDKK